MMCSDAASCSAASPVPLLLLLLHLSLGEAWFQRATQGDEPLHRRVQATQAAPPQLKLMCPLLLDSAPLIPLLSALFTSTSTSQSVLHLRLFLEEESFYFGHSHVFSILYHPRFPFPPHHPEWPLLVGLRGPARLDEALGAPL